jgi:pectin methylesterase-like acyl-CoA thioesterase
MKKQLTRLSALCLMLLFSAMGLAETITATWDFTNADVVAAVTALSGTTEAGTVEAVEANGILLTVEANGQTIRNNGNSIQTGNGVVFKVPVQSKNDVVTVTGYSAPYFAYSIAGTDATEAITSYTATAADVAQGFVEVVNKGQYLIAIQVVQTPAAVDVNATWDYANADVMAQTMAFSGSNEAGTVKAVEDNGVLMTVEANGASFRSNGNNIQVRTGAVFKIPVRNAGDVVSVKGYPNYSYYTIGSNSTEITNTNDNPVTEYTATVVDAQQGFVAVTSTNDNNYFLCLSVLQKAPQDKVTLTDEPATATFAFSEGTEGQTADFGDAAPYFITSKVTWGSNLKLKGKDNKGLGQTQFEPFEQQNEPSGGTAADESNAIRFLIQPGFGFAFTPTKVSVKTTRYGTDNGLIDLSWENPDKTTVALAVGVKPNRDSGNNPANPDEQGLKFSDLSYEVTGATPAEGTCGLLINLYHLQSGKQIGFSDIVIEGYLNGTEKDVPVLATLTINGQEYTAAEIFDTAYEADFELSKTAPMVSAANPISVTAAIGEVGTITYQGDDTHCLVTIPMLSEGNQVDYVLNVVQKPDFTLYYISPEDGQTVLTTQQVEKDAPIGFFQGDAMSNYGIPEGYAMRGWFVRSDGGRKYTVSDIVTSDLYLYGYCTEIETVSTYKKYTFDLTSPTFYAEDHEAFNPTGDGFYYHDAQHGWAFHKDNKIDLLVGPKAVVSVTLCRYGNAGDIVITQDGETIGTLPGKNNDDTDGEIVAFNYEGDGGTITLNLNTEGEMYLHGVKIVNTAEVNYESQGNWYFVKAGDAGSFIDVLEVVNGKNASRDAERAFIFLPDGTYDLRQTVKTAISGHNISIIGQSVDGTIITTKPDKSIEGLGSADMLQNSGSNLYLQDLTLKNALDYYNAGSAGRAAVLQDAGTRTIGKNVRMLSYQDTYYSSNANQQAYWEDCDIHGTVDFICGGGDVRFQNTTISLEPRALDGTGSRTITAPTTKTQFGYVFDGCKVVDLANGKGNWNYGRTWQNQPVCVYLNTTLDANAQSTLIASRWIEKGMNNTDPKLFGEYATKSAAGNDITPASNIITSYGGQFETILSAEQADAFAYDKMFTDWNPALLAKQADGISKAIYQDGQVVLTVAEAEHPNRMFALFKNGELVELSEETAFDITIDPAVDELTVRESNTMGGLCPPIHVEGTTTGINDVQPSTFHLSPSTFNLHGMRVEKAEHGIFIINGKKVVK